MRNKYTQHHQLQQEQEQHQHHHQHHQQRSKFLPMLCSSSSSAKQVIKLSHRRNASTSSSSSSTVSDEPLSPRVGCMGQVKRNNKVVGFPSMSFVTNTSPSNNNIKNDHQISSNFSSNSIVKYHNLIRFFSSKSLTTSPTTTTTIAAAAATVPRSGTHKGKITTARRNTKNSSCNNNNNNSIRSRGTRLNATNTIRDDHGIMISRSKNNDGNCGNINENDKGCLVNLVELDPPLPVVKQQQQENNNGENASLWKRRSGGAPLKGLQLQLSPQSCTLLLQSTTV